VEKVVRVLVVDDYEPWRRFFCSTLRKRPELLVVGEEADGLEAIQKAQQLQPDLILLDIGLPTITGIEAARRIRELSPKSKILFVSEDRAPEVAREALSTGAVGYVVKLDAVRELLPAVEAVLQDKKFVSTSLGGRGLTGRMDWQSSDSLGAPASRVLTLPQKRAMGRHEAEFYSDDRSFLDHLVQFVGVALQAGNAAIVLATEFHRHGLLGRLQAQGLDIRTAMERDRYVALEAADALSEFMLHDMPDPARFLKLLRSLIERAAKSMKGRPARVAIFGECAPLLWEEGNPEAAIQVEKFANRLIMEYDVDILCGYSLSGLRGRMNPQIFERICAEHSLARSK